VAKQITVSTKEIIIETYDNPDFACILRETIIRTERTPDGSESRHSSRIVRPVPNCKLTEYCKALVLANARYGTLMELPYSTGGLGSATFSEPDAVHWWIALTDDNPPGKTTFKKLKDRYQQLREIVETVDFRVYNDDKANEMHEAVVLEITNKLLAGETFPVTLHELTF